MARIAGGALAAAVSDAGGLGVVGGGYGDPGWLDEQMDIVGDSRVGIGLITWNMKPGAVEAALTHNPVAVWMSFGDPVPHIPVIHGAGALAIAQVGTVDEAVAAVNAGADVIVAQGSEAGGHGRPGRALFGLIPAISTAVAGTPVVAAGGINDQAGLDAAQALGASGAALGTAYYATHEALDVQPAKQRLVDARGDDTVHSRVYDHIRGPMWPPGYTGRSISTRLTEEWAGREDELEKVVEPLRAEHQQAAKDADMSIRVVWAGEGLDAIRSIESAAAVTRRFAEVV